MYREERIVDVERMRTMMINENLFSVKMVKVSCHAVPSIVLNYGDPDIGGHSEYAQVVKMLGNGRLEAQCFDGEKRLAHIRGKMRKKVCISLYLLPFFLNQTTLFFHLGLDQPGRYCSIITSRIPGWQSRCYRKIYRR